MTTPTEQARAEAEKLLPCRCGKGGHGQYSEHWQSCPAFYREPVAQAIAALMAERDAEWNKALGECISIVRRHQRDFPVYLRGELEDAIVALRRPDPALNNPDTPGEDGDAETGCADDEMPGTADQWRDGINDHIADANEMIDPTIEELRAKVVEAAKEWHGWWGGRRKEDAFVKMQDAVERLQSKERDLG